MPMPKPKPTRRKAERLARSELAWRLRVNGTDARNWRRGCGPEQNRCEELTRRPDRNETDAKNWRGGRTETKTPPPPSAG
jgi:hypothetical protein